MSYNTDQRSLILILTFFVLDAKRRHSSQSDEAASTKVDLFRQQLEMLRKLFKNQPPQMLATSLKSRFF